MSPFEIGMLLCFGVSWPISVAKTLRTRRVEGKSPLFMAVVALGYVSGCLHKILFSMDFVIVLYLVNLALVLLDLALYYRFRAAPCPRSA